MHRISLLLLPALFFPGLQAEGQTPGTAGTRFIPLNTQRPGNGTPDVFPIAPSADRLPPSGEPREEPEPELFPFDYRQVEIRSEQGRWQLHLQGTVLKDFGSKETDAQEALRIIRLLRLTHYSVVGQPHPVLEYWLADGRAPQSQDKSLRLLPIDLNTLRVEEHQGQWALRDTRRLFFTFGTSQQDALRALALIRHFGFKQIGTIGQPSPSMIYFLGNGPGEAPSPNLLPASLLQAPRLPPARESSRPMTPAGPILPTGYVPGTAPLVAGQPVRLNPQLIVVRREQDDWKLFHGAQVLANFGANANLAHEAMALLHYYRCTEMCPIGTPTSFSYFLVNGQAPRGLKPGLSAHAFNPAAVNARPLGKNWLVCDGDRPLISFGDRPGDAQELVQAIRRYGFDHICQIGSGEGRSLTLLIRSR